MRCCRTDWRRECVGTATRSHWYRWRSRTVVLRLVVIGQCQIQLHLNKIMRLWTSINVKNTRIQPLTQTLQRSRKPQRGKVNKKQSSQPDWLARRSYQWSTDRVRGIHRMNDLRQGWIKASKIDRLFILSNWVWQYMWPMSSLSQTLKSAGNSLCCLSLFALSKSILSTLSVR